MNLLLAVALPVIVVLAALFVAIAASEPCAGCGRHRILRRRRLPFGIAIGCTCLVRSRRN
jgi:hypothetical protein